MPRTSREVLQERKLWLAPLEAYISSKQVDGTYLRRTGIALFNCRHFLHEFHSAGLRPRVHDGVLSLCQKAVPTLTLMEAKDCYNFVDTLKDVEANVKTALDAYHIQVTKYYGRLMEYQVDGSLLEARLYCCPPNTVAPDRSWLPCTYNLWDNKFLRDEFNFQEHWPHLNYERPKLKAKTALRNLIRD